MVEVTSYPPGTPAWVDLSTPDVAGACRFYGAVLGWGTQDTGPAGRGYVLFVVRGRTVAGVGPLAGTDQRPAWTTYVCVEDADASTAVARRAGAAVVLAPLDVLDAGRMAVLSDPTGATVALWQPRGHPGAQLADEAGSCCGHELQTRDEDAAVAFYGAVFGWAACPEHADGRRATAWSSGGRRVAALVGMADEVPLQVPAAWLPYFAVADCDAAVARAVDGGGATLAGPADGGRGRSAVLSDPCGAAFAVLAPAAP